MTKLLRIAHVTATFPPYLAGTGYVAHYQTRELARRGHAVHVFTAATGEAAGDETTPDGVVVHRLPPFIRVGNAPVLPKLLALRDIDLVHLHYPFLSGAEFVWTACQRQRIPYVVNYHNDLIGVGVRAPIFQIYTALLGRRVMQDAARYLAVTADHALHCRLAPIFRRHQERLVELNNGVDIDHFRPLPVPVGHTIRQQLFGDPALRVVLFVGALDAAHYFKGFSTLIQAWKTLHRPAYRLLVIGDGDRRNAYEQEVQKAGLQASVCFVGKIPHQDLPRFYAVADLVVLPSTPPESFGMVLIEGMACGVPVIGSRIPGVRQVVDEPHTGLLVQPASVPDLVEKMQTLLSLPDDERKQMGEAGRRKVEAYYSWQRIGARLETVYGEVLSGSLSAAAS